MKCKKWTIEEDSLIKQYYPTTEVAALQQSFLPDRTINAIHARASFLRVRKQEPEWKSWKFEPLLCACGCGQYTKINSDTRKPNTYITGHNGRGKLKAKRVVCICRTCRKEFFVTENYNRDGTVKYCSKSCMNEGLKGRIGTFTGKHHTEETKDKIRQKNSGSNNSMWGRHQTEVQKNAVRKNMLENNPMHNLDSVRKLQATHKRVMLERYGVSYAMQVPEIKLRMVTSYKQSGKTLGDKHWTRRLGRTEKTRNKTRATVKRLWQDPEFIEKILQGRGRRPNGPEILFINIMPDNVRYTGDGSWWRKLPSGKHKNPDFKVTGESKVIEVFGDYFHKDDNPQELIDLYKQVGIDCLVLWEHELENNLEEVRHRVIAFIDNKPHEQEALV